MRGTRGMWVILVLLLPVFIYAQAFTGTIRGSVTDQTGAVLPGVTITITQVETNQLRTVATNERGDYNVPFLTPGPYRVQAELPGFRTGVRERIDLQVDQVARIDFALQVGEITERLVVTEQAPLVSTDRADVGNVVDQHKVVELPLNGRGFETLALIQPGTLAAADGSALAFRGGFNVAGSREVSNNFIVDGVDNNNLITGEVVYRPNPDVIQEFKVQTNAFSAEFGRGTGGQINITTKAGTNEFRGSAYEFIRNDRLDARNFFEVPSFPKAKLRRNQFGVNIGGPIVKDRTFFLFSYEGLRLREGLVNLSRVPSLAFRNGDFSSLSTPIRDPLTGQPFPGNRIPDVRINPISRRFLPFYPVPNQPGARNLLSAPVVRLRDDSYSARVDHRFGTNDSIMARYSHTNPPMFWPFNALGGRQGVPGFGRNDTQAKTSVSVNYIHILSPSVVNELRLGYNLLHSNRRQVDPIDYASQFGIAGTSRDARDFGLPAISITGFDGIGSYRPQERKDHTYQIQNTVSWQAGSHSVRFGVDLRRFQSNSFVSSSTQGSFTFDGRFTGNAFADFLLGFPTRSQLAGSDDGRIRKTEAYHWFIQDDWRVTDRVTLNLGMRYELNTPGYDKGGRAASFDPVLRRVITGRDPGIPKGIIETDKNNFGPRFGFAWRPFNDDKTVVRGGYGVFYHYMVLGNETSIILFGAPFRDLRVFDAPAGPPVLSFRNPFPADLSRDALGPGSIDRNLRSSYNHNYSVSIQRQLTNDLVVEVAYSGNVGRKLLGNFQINQPRPGPGSLAARRPFPGFANIEQRVSAWNSYFNSLQTRVEKRFSQGFSILSSWTYSKTIDHGSQFSDTPQDSLNVRAERGLADFDVRHRWVLSYIYDLPFGNGRRFLSDLPKVADAILGGWEIAGITTFQSGQPFSATISPDRSNTGARRDRPNLIGNPKIDNPTPSRWIRVEAFEFNAPFTFGNAGRNIMIADGLNNFDFAVMKNFDYRGEAGRIQFRAEFFNFFNHPNFGEPEQTFGTASFGQVTRARDPRQIQFGLKIYY